MPTDRIDRMEDPLIPVIPKWAAVDENNPYIKLGLDPDVLGDGEEGPDILGLGTWRTCVDKMPNQDAPIDHYYWDSIHMNLK